jgi:leucyl-tRNA synthetase
MVVQINGKVRDTRRGLVAIATDEAAVKAIVLDRPKVKAYLDGHEIQKLIFVPKRMVGLVVRSTTER